MIKKNAVQRNYHWWMRNILCIANFICAHSALWPWILHWFVFLFHKKSIQSNCAICSDRTKGRSLASQLERAANEMKKRQTAAQITRQVSANSFSAKRISNRRPFIIRCCCRWHDDIVAICCSRARGRFDNGLDQRWLSGWLALAMDVFVRECEGSCVNWKCSMGWVLHIYIYKHKHARTESKPFGSGVWRRSAWLGWLAGQVRAFVGPDVGRVPL